MTSKDNNNSVTSKNMAPEWVPEAEDRQGRVKGLFGSERLYNGIASVNPSGLWMPKTFEEIAEKIYNFEVKPDDVWIITYPKCGTTWAQEMLWLILNKVNFEEAKQIKGRERIPYIEFQALNNLQELKAKAAEGKAPPLPQSLLDAMTKEEHTLKMAEDLPSPRTIKSHLPLEFLPPKLLDTCKVVFVGRNPKDACVSFYHFCQQLPNVQYKGDFEQFMNLFIHGDVLYGNYWTMIRSAWNHRNHPNLKILWYENMKVNMIPIIEEVAQFLGKHLTKLKILEIDDFLYIDNFRQLYSTKTPSGESKSLLVRKGKVGGWKEYMTNEDNLKKWNDWVAKNSQGIGFDIKY